MWSVRRPETLRLTVAAEVSCASFEPPPHTDGKALCTLWFVLVCVLCEERVCCPSRREAPQNFVCRCPSGQHAAAEKTGCSKGESQLQKCALPRRGHPILPVIPGGAGVVPKWGEHCDSAGFPRTRRGPAAFSSKGEGLLQRLRPRAPSEEKARKRRAGDVSDGQEKLDSGAVSRSRALT